MTRNDCIRRAAPVLMCAMVWTLGGCGDDDPTVILQQHVKEYGSGDALAGVEICLYNGSKCAVTDASGNYSLEVPADKNITLSYHLEGFWPVLIQTRSPEADWAVPDDAFLMDEVSVEVAWSALSVEFNDDKGHFMVSVYDAESSAGASMLADVTVTTSPESGGVLGYVGDNALVSASLSATGRHGGAAFANMTPQTYTVTLSHPTRTCHAMYGIPGSEPNTFKVMVAKTWTTWLVAYCE